MSQRSDLSSGEGTEDEQPGSPAVAGREAAGARSRRAGGGGGGGGGWGGGGGGLWPALLLPTPLPPPPSPTAAGLLPLMEALNRTDRPVCVEALVECMHAVKGWYQDAAGDDADVRQQEQWCARPACVPGLRACMRA